MYRNMRTSNVVLGVLAWTATVLGLWHFAHSSQSFAGLPSLKSSCVATHTYSHDQHTFPEEFPKYIWQTASPEGKEKWAKQSETWTTLNAESNYTFLTDQSSTDFVNDHFSHWPALLQFWHDLTPVILRADLIRYLTMLAVGGTYSDIDTSNLIAVDEWVPRELNDQEINAIVGIEYDDTTYGLFVRNISFCQWTLMSKPGHPIFQNAVQRVMGNLELLARLKRVELSDLELNKAEVLAATGPGMFTDVVLDVLRDKADNITYDTFHEMKEATVFGDVMVLPINGFAGNQKHSHAGDPAYGPRLIQHHFGRSWYAHPTPSPSP